MSSEFNDDDLPLHTRVAERLHQLGWRDACDAQHSNLRNALPELLRMLAPPVDDGGPAFPVDTGRMPDGTYGHQTGGTTWQSGGMTLRDYFAAKALPESYADAMRTEAWKNDSEWRISLALDAYATADAMLKVRSAS